MKKIICFFLLIKLFACLPPVPPKFYQRLQHIRYVPSTTGNVIKEKDKGYHVMRVFWRRLDKTHAVIAPKSQWTYYVERDEHLNKGVGKANSGTYDASYWRFLTQINGLYQFRDAVTTTTLPYVAFDFQATCVANAATVDVPVSNNTTMKYNIKYFTCDAEANAYYTQAVADGFDAVLVESNGTITESGATFNTQTYDYVLGLHCLDLADANRILFLENNADC